jgi:TfoX/Sxy family transcriptional regulator of competence genes
MAYDEMLARRIRDLVEGEPGLSEKKMFGGLAFLVAGNMAVAASGEGGLLLRIDPSDAEELTRHEHVERMEMRGRAMNGWLRVGADALGDDAALERWVATGVEYARSLPAK